MKSRTVLFSAIVVGFASMSVLFAAFSFPLTLMGSAAPSVYRFFNIVFVVSFIVGCAAFALICAKGSARLLVALTIVGYALLATGIVSIETADLHAQQFAVVLSGSTCGFGLACGMAFWFGLLTFSSERRESVMLGCQSLIGGAAFFAIASTISRIPLWMALCFCAIAGACSYIAYRTAAAGSDVHAMFPADGELLVVHASGETLPFPPVLLFPVVGFAALSFVFGIVEPGAMGAARSPFGAIVSYAGAPIGSLIFLAWIGLSRKRDYDLMIKIIFLATAAALLAPNFDIVVLTMSIGYEVSWLLLCALLLDVLGFRRRYAMATAAITLAASKALLLTGLFVPGLFGIRSYDAYLETKPFLLFLIYLLFCILLLVGRYQHARDVQRMDEAMQTVLEKERIPRAEEARPDDGGIATACHSLSVDYGLTKREAEVLEFFAHGRDVAFVCDALYLSRNTVKSYSKLIYAKLGVHTKQELIDLVELREHDTL